MKGEGNEKWKWNEVSSIESVCCVVLRSPLEGIMWVWRERRFVYCFQTGNSLRQWKNSLTKKVRVGRAAEKSHRRMRGQWLIGYHFLQLTTWRALLLLRQSSSVHLSVFVVHPSIQVQLKGGISLSSFCVSVPLCVEVGKKEKWVKGLITMKRKKWLREPSSSFLMFCVQLLTCCFCFHFLKRGENATLSICVSTARYSPSQKVKTAVPCCSIQSLSSFLYFFHLRLVYMMTWLDLWTWDDDEEKVLSRKE